MDKKLRDMTVTEILELTASDAPAPGGGSISALVAGLGSALGQMVLALTFGKKAYEALDEGIQGQLQAEDEELARLRERLLELVDTDTEAFTAYMDALKMPKETETEKAQRSQALADAAIFSMQVPLETAERCLNVLKCLPPVARYGNKNAVTDAGVAALTARAACEGALLNVKINLPSVKDEQIRDKAASHSEAVLKEANAICEEVMEIVYSKL
ncbi:MAG: cyclodeaminase/cyclohydrolase family protein [Eubacteriales bacterium]|nr:cyclodeaminase/cyclohydrolase family protein [Eubacteriales bacterium]